MVKRETVRRASTGELVTPGCEDECKLTDSALRCSEAQRAAFVRGLYTQGGATPSV